MSSLHESAQTVAVAGATGYLGRYLVTELRSRGYEVRALVRSIDRAHRPGTHGAPALSGLGIEFVQIDLEYPSQVAGVLAGATRLVSALGVTGQSASPWDIDFRANLALLEEAERIGLESMLYIGAIVITRGASAVQRAKHAFVEVLKRSSVSSQIVHPSGYFSDLANLLTMVGRGIKVHVGEGDTKLNPIHGADLAAYCVDRLEAPGEWEVGGPEVFTYHELLDQAACALGRNPRDISLPRGVLEVSSWIAPRVSPRAGNLADFFADMMTHDAVGEPTGIRTVGEFFAQVVSQDKR